MGIGSKIIWRVGVAASLLIYKNLLENLERSSRGRRRKK